MKRKKNRKYGQRGIPIMIVVGIIIAIAFGMIFGWMMLLRYLMGALLFATVTVSLIAILRKLLGKKVWKIW